MHKKNDGEFSNHLRNLNTVRINILKIKSDPMNPKNPKSEIKANKYEPR